MDTFVVRIRASSHNDPGLRGVVDEVASGLRSAFHNSEELLMILMGTATPDARGDADSARLQAGREHTDGGKRADFSSTTAARWGLFGASPAPSTAAPRITSATTGRRLRTCFTAIAAVLAMFAGAGAATASAASTVAVWPAATALALPSDADTAPSGHDAGLLSVDCTSPGNCVGVGYYWDANGADDSQAMASTETGGVWAQPTKVALPSNKNVSSGGQAAELNSVSCTSPGNCVAGGTYTDTHGSADYQAMVVAESNGVWGTATEVVLPSGANTSSGGQQASMYSVACTTAANCVAVGNYTDGTESFQAMVATETSGTWTQAVKVELPTGADTGAADQNASLVGLSCPSAGNCVAVGQYADGSALNQLMAVNETSGVWAQAKELGLPADANPAFPNPILNSVTCTGAGDCVAVGRYVPTISGGSPDEPMVATETAGVWAQPIRITLPTGAGSTVNQQAALDSVSCTSAGTCVAGGSFVGAGGNGDFEAMTVNETGGVWQQASELGLPPIAAPTPGVQDGEIHGVMCLSLGNCVAVGHYSDAGSNGEAMAVTSVPSLTLSTTSLAAAATGTAYSAGLASAGGAGATTWSLSSGTLPAGLTLNASTGLISGTPTALGTSTFTITASDPGPPAQQASSAFSIVVGGPSIAVVKNHGSELTVVVSCDAAALLGCTGALTLTTLEHLSGHKLTAVSARKKPKKPKKTTRTVTLAGKGFAVAGGAQATLTIALNKAGKQLLAKRHKFPANLAVASTGVGQALATTTVTFKQAKATHKHH
jgi:hypothetical protein